MKRLASYAAAISGTLALLVVLYYFRAIILLFLLSLFVAAGIRPVIVRLRERGVPGPIALAAPYLFGLLLMGLWLLVSSSALLREGQELLNQLALQYERLHPIWSEGSMVQQTIAGYLPPPDRLYDAIAADEGTLLAQALVGVGRTLATLTGSIIAVLVVSVYWSLDRVRFERLWLGLVPAGRRSQARRLWRTVEEGVGRYLFSETVQAFLAVLLLGAGYLALGLSFPTILAFVGGVAWLIPFLGGLLAILPVILAGLISSPLMAIAAALYTLLVFLGMELVVEPRLFDRRRLNSSLLTVLAMIPLAYSYGLLGILAAPPLAVALKTLLVSLMTMRRQPPVERIPAQRIANLEDRLQEARQAVPDDEVSPELESLTTQLEKLLHAVGQTLADEQVQESAG